MPTRLTIETIKNQYFLTAFKNYMLKLHQDDNFNFLFDKAGNEALYNKYIKVGAPQEVNLSDKMRQPLITLAAQKKWSGMTAGIKDARKSIAVVINGGGLPQFLATPDGQLAGFMVAAGVDGLKAPNMAALLKVYKSPRTPQDQQDAHAAMLKLTSLSLLNPALRTIGLEPPARVMPKKGDPTKALKLMGVPSTLAPQMAKLITAYSTATNDSGRNAALAQMDKIAKGIVKHEAIIAGLKSSGIY